MGIMYAHTIDLFIFSFGHFDSSEWIWPLLLLFFWVAVVVALGNLYHYSYMI